MLSQTQSSTEEQEKKTKYIPVVNVAALRSHKALLSTQIQFFGFAKNDEAIFDPL